MWSLKRDNAESKNQSGQQIIPSAEEQEATLKKKYGGVFPKRPPLISQDHERAYFDSADWALGKQGKPSDQKTPESLQPKLQRTPHQPLPPRWPSFACGSSLDGNGAERSN